MGKHRTEDYKLSAVKYYLKSGSYRKTCKIFDCKKSSLSLWVKKYQKNKKIQRKKRIPKKRKVTEDIMKFVKEHIYSKPNVTLKQLSKLIKQKYKVKLHYTTVYKIIKELGITRKKLRKRYYPFKKKDQELDNLIEFYEEILDIDKKKVISIDETAIYLNMTLGYGRSKKGRRAYLKTHIYPFKKYNMLCAIKCGKVVGYELYGDLQRGIGQKEFIEFIDKHIKNKYVNHTILLDNASFHRSNNIKSKILSTNNTYKYTIPYHPETNPIEEFFNQLKHYIKLESPQSFQEIVRVVHDTIRDKIKPIHLKNYFNHLYMRAVNYTTYQS